MSMRRTLYKLRCPGSKSDINTLTHLDWFVVGLHSKPVTGVTITAWYAATLALYRHIGWYLPLQQTVSLFYVLRLTFH